MGTRGCVAWATKDGWKGVYNHWDSYPTGLGKEVWDEIKKIGATALVKSLKQVGDWREHLSGGVCEYCGEKAGQPHSISGVLFGKRKEGVYPDPEAKHHEHGDGKKSQMTHKDADPLFIEWVYVIDPKLNTLSVLTHISMPDTCHKPDPKAKSDGSAILRKDGYMDYGHCAYKHVSLTTIDLNGPEPNWEEIEQIEITEIMTSEERSA